MPRDRDFQRVVPASVLAPPAPLGFWQSYRAARRNVLELIPEPAYREPVLSGGKGPGWVMVMDPDGVERVLRTRESAYPKSPFALRLLKPREGDNLLTATGQTWSWQRRAMAPMFQSRNLRHVAPLMTDVAEATADRIGAKAGQGDTIDVYPEMVDATCDIIIDIALSGRQTLDRDELTRGITFFIEHVARMSLLDFIGAPKWIPRPSRLLIRAVPRLDEMADRIIATRKAEGPSNPPDMLDMLIAARDPETGRGMTDIELRNNLLTFVTAGHETTALALTWALYLLAFDQAVQQQARYLACDVLGSRAAEAEDLKALGYIRQVLEEALRLYPPAGFLSRRATEEDELAGARVLPSTIVFLPVYAIHRHRLLWDDPDAFDPDRFDAEAVRARHRFAYLPFAAGPRVCIGSNLALMEAQIILATLLSRFSFTIPEGFVARPQMWFTLRPAGGMPLEAAPL